MLIFEIAFWLVLLFFTVMAISVFLGVPFLPTHNKQAERMIQLSGLKQGMRAVDLGSGDGRLLFLAAKTGANVVGYELNPFLFLWSKILISIRRLAGVEVKFKSIYKADLKDVDVVLAFLFPKPMERLGPKLFSELKPGAKILSYTFPIPDKTPVSKVEGIYEYHI